MDRGELTEVVSFSRNEHRTWFRGSSCVNCKGTGSKPTTRTCGSRPGRAANTSPIVRVVCGSWEDKDCRWNGCPVTRRRTRCDFARKPGQRRTTHAQRCYERALKKHGG
mmetsp:Transcript_7852/g.29414  ORF Transcript_7852/g.29414 Transcript_7852/m.29414 type:complete len:109 (-) Transcript_7852:61-387(-)